MSETLTLHEKLAKIRDIADVAVKDKRGYNYTYTDVTQILSKVKAGMKKYNVLLTTTMVPETATVQQNVIHNTKVDKAGQPFEQVVTEMLFCAQMLFTWIDCSSGERIEAPWFITGSMPDCSQSLGAACSYGMRQFLTSYFQIPQVAADDVDAYRSRQREAEEAENVELASQIISQFDLKLKMYLADHQDQTDKVKAFVKKYAKSGDYFKIKEAELAGKLLRDFTATFIDAQKQEGGD